jgi:hypothetical protein
MPVYLHDDYGHLPVTAGAWRTPFPSGLNLKCTYSPDGLDPLPSHYHGNANTAKTRWTNGFEITFTSGTGSNSEIRWAAVYWPYTTDHARTVIGPGNCSVTNINRYSCEAFFNAPAGEPRAWPDYGERIHLNSTFTHELGHALILEDMGEMPTLMYSSVCRYFVYGQSVPTDNYDWLTVHDNY